MAAHGHTATVSWSRADDPAEFARGRYSRAHEWRFDGGVTVPASPSPAVVPAPMSRDDAVDPEEAYVAALASCHMLTVVDLARRAGFVVDAYEDTAEATMERLEQGRSWVSRVVLRPRVTFSGERRPDAGEIDALHGDAHRFCFLANSVRTEVTVETA